MTFDVMLLNQPGNGYIARPVLWPDTQVQGATEQEALAAVRALILDLLSRTRFVRVEVEMPADQTGNPWIDKAGMFANDPTWDDFLKTIEDYRRRLDSGQATLSV